LEKAEAGAHLYNATIFDGSDEDGPVEINSFIGDVVEPYAKAPAQTDNIDMTLLQNKGKSAWPFSR